ncbi:MAG: helix-turn-helix domain-containing protein [Candidatus Eremiobacteraeota bacterium]|nr:helix-turn-helix domain-containing protein [Candidatus Eremiobacteraeota bacterium]
MAMLQITGRELEMALRALANDRRLLILEWLRDPRAHFREQVDGDLIEDGVCGVQFSEKLALSQPTVSEHLGVLSRAGLLSSKRIKQWTFYKRDEKRIALIKKAINKAV